MAVASEFYEQSDRAKWFLFLSFRTSSSGSSRRIGMATYLWRRIRHGNFQSNVAVIGGRLVVAAVVEVASKWIGDVR